MKNIKKIGLYFLGLFVVFLFIGCGETFKSLKIGEISSNNKSITVPSTGSAMFEIKQKLLENGWKVKVQNIEVEKNKLDSFKSNTKIVYDTTYRLDMSYVLRATGEIRSFNISIINNNSNEEVLNLVGANLDFTGYNNDDIAQNLINNMKEITK